MAYAVRGPDEPSRALVRDSQVLEAVCHGGTWVLSRASLW
jgi:hypothetical protein